MTITLPIYLDNHATTPVDSRVLEVMLPYFTQAYGNAASKDHPFGFQARDAVERAREQLAQLISARPEEITFTSGATESDNIALFGVAERYADRGDHIITAVTEHPGILDAARRLEQMGKRVTYLPVDQYGRVDPEDVRRAITPRTIMISIMMANNEIGTISNVQEIGHIAHEHEVVFHTDAAHAVGHILVNVRALNIDVMSFSAHKFYGPKGIGALFARRSSPRIKLAPLVYGGGHERGLRSGTLNVPAIVGFGAAAEIAGREMEPEATRFREWTCWILERLQTDLGDAELNGHPTERLPHNLNVSIAGIESKSLIVGLKDVAISAGSACSTDKAEPSHVILALGFGEARAHSAIRIGIGRQNTQEEIEYATDRIVSEAKRLRKLVPQLGGGVRVASPDAKLQ
jgi:cysteine desulfurase